MKKFLNKYVITTAIFIVSIMYISIVTYANNARELYNSLKTSESLKTLIASVDDVFNKKLFGFDNFIKVYSMSEVVLDKQIFEDAQYDYLIKDSHGKFHFPYKKVDVSSYAEKLIALDKKLKQSNIPLLYVQAPNKKLKSYTVYPAGTYNYANENADEFLEKISKENVDYLDLREEIERDNLDKSQLFYKTDHHWTTTTAFWAFVKIVDKLNEQYDFNIDEENYYRNINNYKVTEYKENFLGSLGRRLERYITGLDDYTFIEPAYKTDYDIYYPLHSTDTTFRSGEFINSIAYENILNNEDIKTNRHATYFEYDYGKLIIKNKLIDNDKKILIIKDSFALPTVAFLSTCINEIHMVDLRAKGAPAIADYIEQNKFDAVVILYNTEVFGDPMFNFE